MDNVFITSVVTVQYQVLREKVYEAFYSLTNPVQQMTAHIYDVIRSQLPTLELDAVFEAKEELSLAVKNALSDTFNRYGYQILQALITDLEVKCSLLFMSGAYSHLHIFYTLLYSLMNVSRMQ